MKNYHLLIILSVFLTLSCNSDKKKEEPKSEDKKNERTEKAAKAESTTERPEIVPIQHATFFMRWDQKDIYVDPVGGKAAFERFPEPDLIFITDVHPDHLDVETLAALGKDYKIIAPKAVHEKLPESHQELTRVMNNGDESSFYGFSVKALPMYNTTSSRKDYHTKGRGNGYQITKGEFDLYISGDTEVTPEMKRLKDIDIAFLCMNLPYTMSAEQALKGVMAFQPEKVIPYHYRGKKDGETYFENVQAFKEEVESSADIEVQLMDWYTPKNKDA